MRKGETASGQQRRLTPDDFLDEYSSLVAQFDLEPSEEVLLKANDLGKRALDSAVSILDIASAHAAVIHDIVDTTTTHARLAAVEKVSRVFVECLAAFEVTVRGFWDKLDEERRKSEEDVKAVFASAQDGVFLFDEHRSLIECNRAFANMLGFSRKELKQVTGDGREHPLGGISESALSQLVEKGYFDEYEQEFMRRDGSFLIATVSGSMIGTSREADSWRAFAFVKDVTEQKRYEKDLERINAELDVFAQSVSHDLRSPLSAIVLANQMLYDAVLEEDPEVMRADVRDVEQTIRRSLRRSYDLIDDILALAESGQKPVLLSEVDIGAVVRAVRDDSESAIKSKNVILEANHDLGVVRASQTHMHQLFSNLITNAIQHNNTREPLVEVRYHGRDGQGRYRYLVRDNGPGIPEGDIEDIFNPFFKKGPGSSTGIGLAIVKKVLSVYGGSIRVYNDSGACFEFTLKDWEEKDL